MEKKNWFSYKEIEVEENFFFTLRKQRKNHAKNPD